MNIFVVAIQQITTRKMGSDPDMPRMQRSPGIKLSRRRLAICRTECYNRKLLKEFKKSEISLSNIQEIDVYLGKRNDKDKQRESYMKMGILIGVIGLILGVSITLVAGTVMRSISVVGQIKQISSSNSVITVVTVMSDRERNVYNYDITGNLISSLTITGN